MTKNIEVEIRALLDDISSFKKTIENLGAELTSSLYLCDVYFCKEEHDKVEDVEMNEVGSYSLRLRKTKKDNQEEFTINTKTITNHGDHSAWQENEIKIDNFSEATDILKIIGFKPFFKLEKERFVYKIDGMKICVEDIIDFKGAVEIEIMCSEDEVDQAKKKIKEFLNKCNVKEKDIAPKSITNIIMKERAFKKEIDL